MKVCIVQPHYSVDYSDSESLFRWEPEVMDQCDDSIDLIGKAHAHGIRCNVFWSDDAEETCTFLHMGIDTILTNDYHRIAQVMEA